jgi:mannose-6-phosphate isomerase
VINGSLAGHSLHSLIQQFRTELLGPVRLAGGAGQFPILVKFLDARDDLSLQVHPDQAYADANPGAHLKTEAWCILQSDPGSRLLKGLKPGVTRAAFAAALGHGDVNRLIESVPAREGDCFYLPSGTVHALGAGLLVAEVQTPSDTTFRVFDFNRIDPSTGKRRALHVEQAMQCIDFSNTPASDPGPRDVRRVTCPYFHLDRRGLLAGDRHQFLSAGPTVLIVTEGELEMSGDTRAARGEVVLIPAAMTNSQTRAASDASFLEVTFPV